MKTSYNMPCHQLWVEFKTVWLEVKFDDMKPGMSKLTCWLPGNDDSSSSTCKYSHNESARGMCSHLVIIREVTEGWQVLCFTCSLVTQAAHKYHNMAEGTSDQRHRYVNWRLWSHYMWSHCTAKWSYVDTVQLHPGLQVDEGMPHVHQPH